MAIASQRRNPFRASYYIPVAGGRLHVARAGPRPGAASAVVVGIHGITATHVAWRPVARALLDLDVCLLAPDLRGRGSSAHLPSAGFRAHVDDVVSVLDQLGVEQAVLAGHSMGAYVVARVAAEHPRLASGVVLVDGGLPLAVPKDVDPHQALEDTLGPALARLRMTFDSTARYVEFWRAHPAFASWSDDLEAYVSADLGGHPGAMRSVTSEAAVRSDGVALLTDAVTRCAAERVRAPLHLLRAPRGLLNDDRVMVPDAALDRFLTRRPDLTTELVEDTNHYSILTGDGAPRVAAALTRQLMAAY
jgi:lipase